MVIFAGDFPLSSFPFLFLVPDAYIPVPGPVAPVKAVASLSMSHPCSGCRLHPRSLPLRHTLHLSMVSRHCCSPQNYHSVIEQLLT